VALINVHFVFTLAQNNQLNSLFTTTTTTTILQPSVQDYLDELVPKETFTHSHLSWSINDLLSASSIYYDL